MAGGRGPKCFDCWGLLRWVYLQQMGVDLDAHQENRPKEVADNVRVALLEQRSGAWVEESAPAHLYAVGMSGGQQIHHVGVFLDCDGGVVLHCADGKGVMAQPISVLKALGMSNIVFYRHEQHRYLR